MKSVKNFNFKNEKALVRVDFNVPLDEQGNITDDTRIRGVLPTVNYALDEHEKDAILKRLAGASHKGKINIQRFKGLGEMNPAQLRETTMLPDSRRLVQLTLDNEKSVFETMDMLLARKRSPDRKRWLEKEGDLAESEI